MKTTVKSRDMVCCRTDGNLLVGSGRLMINLFLFLSFFFLSDSA